eukprot:4085221-Amphidinium_carterae.1
MLTVCIAWKWYPFALGLALGFFGLLRPQEVLNVRVKHLLLPSKTLDIPTRMFVLLGKTKTA